MQARKIAPYALALALFFALGVAYFLPQFEGKILPQHDVQMYEGMTRDILESRERYGEDPQWTGAMFGGMPAYLINVAYPAALVKGTVGQVPKAVGEPAAFLIFACAGFWLMLLLMGIDPRVGIVPALAYGLSTYFLLIIGAGHLTKMWALVYAPPMMGSLFYAFRGNRWLGAALLALCASLEIGAGHPQITYYFGMAMAAFWISEGIVALRRKAWKGFLKTTAAVALAGALAVGSNFAPLWYTAQHSPETIRGGSELAEADAPAQGLDLQYATAWSYGPLESLNLLVPDLMGGDSGRPFSRDGAVADALRPYGLESVATQLPAYWGEQPYTAGPTYLGAVTIFLCALGLLIACGRNKWWLAAISLLALLLAWGSHLMGLTELFFRWLPGYNKFRTVSMILVIVQWSVPLLAALALARACRPGFERRELLRPLAWAAGITGGICLLLALAGGSLFDFGRADAIPQMTEQWRQMLLHSAGERYVEQGLHNQLGVATADGIALERARIMRADAWRSLLFIALSAAALWLYARRRIGCTAMLVALGVLVAADLIPVDMRYLPQSNFVGKRQASLRPTEADRYILQDPEPGFRVLNLTVSPFNDATTSYFHRSVGGYHGAKLARYQDVIDRYLSQLPYGIDSSARKVLELLNTKYMIVPTEQGGIGVERNAGAMGPAWLVERVEWVDTPRAEIEALGRIDPRRTAVADRRFAAAAQTAGPAADTTGTIRLEEYRPNYLRYAYSSPVPRVALFSEIYYDKGWTAYLDGEPAPYFRADYILRAMALPAGDHTIEWRFAAPRFALIEGITLACSLVVLGGALAAGVWLLLRRRRANKNENPPSDER